MLKNFFILCLFSIFLYSSNYPICTARRFNTEVARAQIEKILDIEPENVKCLLQLANIYLKKGKLTKGFEILTDAYGIDPSIVKNSEIAKIIPFALQVTKLRKEALKTNNFIYWNKLADGYYELSILDEAIIGYGKSLKINPHQDKIRLKLALAYRQNGQIYSCISEVKKVLLHNKENFYANYYMAKILKEDFQNHAESVKYFKISRRLLEQHKKDIKYIDYTHILNDISKGLMEK
ncbi:MAG: hypothetical protein R3331_07860 [Sulfurospirillaceae bacterium]|nr:hypothetical protein [Sulfurospirillaceae bacterium]